MVVKPINGLDIDFPYPPYPAQIRYISSVITALRNKQNALLESPTGTGKTLCLLLATLAWRSVYTAALQSLTHKPDPELLKKAGLQQPKEGSAASALNFLRGGGGEGSLGVPKIVYCSRTHTQLAQAVGELKKTIYRPYMTILASRDQMCVHDIASNFSGGRLSSMCRKLVNPQKRECKYYLPVMSNRSYENKAEQLLEKMSANAPMDIEDLKQFGRTNCACPWYLSRLAAQNGEVEILFLPYNYLLDRATRASLDIDWSHDVVIFDEAHNLESVCADAMSFDLTQSLRDACDGELGKLVEGGLRPGGLTIPALEKLAQEGAVESVIGSENRDLLEIKLMRAILDELGRFANSVQFENGEKEVGYQVFPGNQIKLLFQQCNGPTVETYTLFLESLDRAMGIQADQTTRTDTAKNNSALRILQTAIRVLFESAVDGDQGAFRTVVHANHPGDRTLSYWCFKPSVAMKCIQNLKLRCLLLTSGTLSPMDSFASELALPFPIRLENPHVVTKPQIWAGVLKQGPSNGEVRGERLTSAFRARGQGSDVQLGRALIRIASIVPDGLLVFFPSYSSLYSSVKTWKEVGPGANGAKPSIWEHLQRHKRVVAEERESSHFAAAILAHRAHVDSKAGSILLAVCRGKVSEGIDFSDEYGRAVVITGLPYPSAYDPRIILKREFADEEAKRYRSKKGRKGHVLSGAEWYTIQALRAVNQAIGRAIRHRFDYGAIILCEERFQAATLQQQISKWIRPSLSVCKTFMEGETSLKTFFRFASQSDFARAAQKQKGEIQQRISNTSQVVKEDGTKAVLQAQQAITKIAPPPQTDEQFLQKLYSISEGMNSPKRRRVEKSLESTPTTRLLDFSESARGGMFDSGSLRIAVSPLESDGPKRSTRFLAARAERIDDDAEGGDTVKQPKSQTRKIAEMKLSERIRKTFPEARDRHEFLGLFKQILSAHKKLSDGIGPLLSARMASNEAENGRQAITKVINFTKSKLESAKAQELLQAIRTKIPKQFQTHYETICTQRPPR